MVLFSTRECLYASSCCHVPGVYLSLRQCTVLYLQPGKDSFPYGTHWRIKRCVQRVVVHWGANYWTENVNKQGQIDNILTVISKILIHITRYSQANSELANSPFTLAIALTTRSFAAFYSLVWTPLQSFQLSSFPIQSCSRSLSAILTLLRHFGNGNQQSQTIILPDDLIYKVNRILNIYCQFFNQTFLTIQI